MMKHKIKKYACLLIIFGGINIVIGNSQESNVKILTFKSADNLEITADWYSISDSTAPIIILYHQAGWSRGEYIEIAPKLNAMGFQCLAVDQRSGGEVNSIINQTNSRALLAGLSTNYLDALPDLTAALDFIHKMYPENKIILWGSSYSSSLTLKVAGDNQKFVSGVLAFSPGEYFERFGESSNFIQSSAKNIICPAFITSASNEHGQWKNIFESIPGMQKTFFLPQTAGNHGSRALWEIFPDNEQYRQAVTIFLSQYKENNTE